MCNCLFPWLLNLIFLVCQGYVLIVKGGYCTLANGEPSFCTAKTVKTKSECEADCTYLGSCVGYLVNTYLDFCFIYTNVKNSCPSSYIFNEEEHFAMTPNDLKGETVDDQSFSSSRCYRKINGKKN